MANLDTQIEQGMIAIKKLKMQRDDQEMKLEVQEKDFQKTVDTHNQQVDVDREIAELERRRNFLQKTCESTDELIHTKHVESGKEKKEGDMRTLVHEAHDQSKREEVKYK